MIGRRWRAPDRVARALAGSDPEGSSPRPQAHIRPRAARARRRAPPAAANAGRWVLAAVGNQADRSTRLVVLAAPAEQWLLILTRPETLRQDRLPDRIRVRHNTRDRHRFPRHRLQHQAAPTPSTGSYPRQRAAGGRSTGNATGPYVSKCTSTAGAPRAAELQQVRGAWPSTSGRCAAVDGELTVGQRQRCEPGALGQW